MKSIWRGYKIKERKIASQKQDDKNVKIYEEEVAACPDGTPPDDTEEGVSEKKLQEWKFNEGKNVKFPDVTSLDDMEKGVGDEYDDNTGRLNE